MESLLVKYRCEKAADATHLSLIGGKFRIDSLDLFHRMYFKMISSTPAYLVEKVRYPCRWYIDVDKQDPAHLLNRLKDLLSTYGKRCVVSMPESHDGAHVVFPDIVVKTKEDAMRRTQALLQDTPFDTSVYRSGLRMLGSKKSRTVNRVYAPVFGIDADGNLADIDTCTLDHLKDSSIFCGPTTSDPAPTTPDPAPTTSDPGSVSCMTADFGFLHPEYANVCIQVQKVKQYINVMSNSTYCMNIQRKHKSNRVYFVIYEHPKTKVVTVHARCFCTCDHTGCKDYKSPFIRMPLLLYFRLKQILH